MCLQDEPAASPSEDAVVQEVLQRTTERYAAERSAATAEAQAAAQRSRAVARAAQVEAQAEAEAARSAATKSAAPRLPDRFQDDPHLGRYRLSTSFPPAPADKPWLKPGGYYQPDSKHADRYVRVAAKRVTRKIDQSIVGFYILAFYAVKSDASAEAANLLGASSDKLKKRIFAASKHTQATREAQALAWLRSDDDADDSDYDCRHDSTQARVWGR